MPPTDVNDQAQTAIAKRDEGINQAALTLTQMVEKRAVALYDDVRAQEFVSALVSASERNPKIKQCNPQSVIAAMMACIMLDLTPETNQQFAYLIPYSGQIQFQIGYKGLIELAYRSGMVTSINAELVFPDDNKFEFSLGTDRRIDHIPNMDRDRTKIEDATHVYATATLMNGTTVFDVMSMSEINKIRETVKAKSTDAPWKTWPEQMAKKTVIKRLMKYLPQSRKDNRVHQAATWDSWAEAGKLAYKDGDLIEGQPEPQKPEEQAPRQLKAFAKPPEDLKPVAEHITEPAEEQPPLVDNSPYPDEPVKSTADFRAEIKDMLEFLKLSKREEMRIASECAETPLIEKAKPEGVRKIYYHLKEIADAKTLHLADKEGE